MILRSLRGLILVLAFLATLMLVVAVIVRCTIQDRVDGFLFLFFATPWPVIAAGCAICSLYWFRHHCRFTAGWLAVLSLVCGVAWLAHDWQWRPSTSARGKLRVIHWNVDRPDWRQVWTFGWLTEQDADIIAIAEREPKKRKMAGRWQTAFPGYRHVAEKHEMLLLVRGEVLSVNQEMDREGSFATAMRVRIRGHDVTVLQADIKGTPWISRVKSLGELSAIVDKHRGENVILLGDFNTPLDSVHIAPIREKLTNAFESVGSGCKATWPLPVPVLSLDQIWASAGLRPVRCEHISLWQSDHRAVVAEFDFAEGK